MCAARRLEQARDFTIEAIRRSESIQAQVHAIIPWLMLSALAA
jgi:hypothetical protein